MNCGLGSVKVEVWTTKGKESKMKGKGFILFVSCHFKAIEQGIGNMEENV